MAHSDFSSLGSFGGGTAGGNNVMTVKASSEALAIDDLLYMNGQGYVFPAQSTAWAPAAVGNGNAGAALVPETSLGNAGKIPGDVRQTLWVNPADQCIFTVCTSNSPSMPTVFKFSPAGLLLATANFDWMTDGGSYNLVPLSNGNLLVTWTPSTAQQRFVILDTDLNFVVHATAIPGPASNVQNWIHAIALKDGGFAVAISAVGSEVVSVFFGVYTNTGVPVRVASAIPSTAKPQNGARCAQLSNGNIAVAIASDTPGSALGVAIFNSAGAAILGYTLIENTGGGGGQPDISALPGGGFCVGAEMSGSTSKLFVLNNAGAVQGAGILVNQVPSGPIPKFRIQNDGTHFWALYMADTTTLAVRRLTASGATVVTSIPVNLVGLPFIADFIIERGMIVMALGNKIWVMAIRPDGYVAQIANATAPTAISTGNGDHFSVRPGGDFTMVAFTPAPSSGATPAKLRVWRYLDVALLGVCQTTLPAGNKDVLVRVAVGPSVQRINPLPGPAACAFDSSANRVVGNKGYLLQNSIAMKGYI